MTAGARRASVWVALLAALYVAVLLAGPIAPYAPGDQNRDLPFAPPTRVHLVGPLGQFHLRPFVYRTVGRPGRADEYEEDRNRPYPLRFLPHGAPYTIAGIVTGDRHLFGVDAPATVFLFGSDQFGRDLFSRVLFGGQVSLVAGVLAASLALILGLALGGLAGFYGGWADDAIMRTAELVLALPWLYLLFAIRSVLPLHLDPVQAFLLIVAVIGIVGWARPARLIRGVVLSARRRDHVVAARAFGATDVYLLRRHVLPQTAGLVVTQLTLLIPQYILAEITLSFFGLGVGEPVPSWGTLLSDAQRYDVLSSYWWMLLPGIALIPVFLLYYALANTLHHAQAPVSQ
jgi:peptide/nickel transport system permease protein